MTRTAPDPNEIAAILRRSESSFHAAKLRRLLIFSTVCNLLLIAALCGYVRGSFYNATTTGAAHAFSTSSSGAAPTPATPDAR